MYELYVYDMRELDDKKEYERMFNNASTERKEKAIRGRSREHIGAAAVLDMALKKHGMREKDIRIEYGRHGKPYILNSNLYFNISHSGDYVVCVMNDAEVGVDIQKIGGPKLNVARRFFTKNEYMHIMNQPDENARNIMFYRLWAIKESFLKAIGTGMDLSFDSFEIEMGTDISVRQLYNDREYIFVEKNIPGYTLAICLEK